MTSQGDWPPACAAPRGCGELGTVQHLFARGTRAAASCAIAVLALGALCAAGCSRQPGTSPASTASCAQFGESAIRQHVTVTTLPQACRGLTAAQVNAAADTALRSAASGVRGKASRRARIAAASHYLVHMFAAVPAPGGEPTSPVAAGGLGSKTTWGLLALGTWLATVALGLWLMASRTPRDRGRRWRVSLLRRPPRLNLAHMGLGGVSLLAWVVYLTTAVTGVAWAAAGLLPLVAGLGMALLFLSWVPASAAGPDGLAGPVGPDGLAGPDGQPRVPAGSAQALAGPARRRRAPVLIVGAHVMFATATILFAVLAAIGAG